MSEVKASAPESSQDVLAFVPAKDQKEFLSTLSSLRKLVKKEGCRFAYGTRKKYQKKLESVRLELERERKDYMDLVDEHFKVLKLAERVKNELEKKNRAIHEMRMEMTQMKLEYQAQGQKLIEKERNEKRLLEELEELKEEIKSLKLGNSASIGDSNLKMQDARKKGLLIKEKDSTVSKSSPDVPRADVNLKRKMKGKSNEGGAKAKERKKKKKSAAEILRRPVKTKFSGDAYVSPMSGQLKSVSVMEPGAGRKGYSFRNLECLDEEEKALDKLVSGQEEEEDFIASEEEEGCADYG